MFTVINLHQLSNMYFFTEMALVFVYIVLQPLSFTRSTGRFLSYLLVCWLARPVMTLGVGCSFRFLNEILTGMEVPSCGYD